ncbi:Predicted transporter (major facilitator superfamily) [Ceraceosorus bombacis]|uniref:Predicted transporter (Major facilitator superfamily) n=1 Tax=Ceraceosorus bombacis TaxID=401625 RepID=A0A0P1BG66_9BASI|nr:Predicted transporter (major facilitator superfamily) [Ceraceosorus bombacis]
MTVEEEEEQATARWSLDSAHEEDALREADSNRMRGSERQPRRHDRSYRVSFAPSEREIETERAVALEEAGLLEVARRRRRRSYIAVYLSIFSVSYVTSLDANTGFLYLNLACSEFDALASFSTIAIAQQLCYAIAKPPIAKLSDVWGRAEAYMLSLLLYMLGIGLISTAHCLQKLLAGIVLQACGNTGVQVLQSIIIADTTTAQWRGLAIGIVNTPYLINFAIGGPLVRAVLDNNLGWRGGYALWLIFLPISAAPLLITLIVGQRRAKKAGILVRDPVFRNGFFKALKRLAVDIDALGLLLFSAGLALCLVPLTLASRGTRRSEAPACALAGLGLLLAFAYQQTRAQVPMIPYRILRNTTVVSICMIAVVDFASFYLSWTFVSAFVQVAKGWDQAKTGYFATTQNVTSTVVGIFVGWLMAKTRRFKTILVTGVLVRLLGVAMMVRYRNADTPSLILVLSQLAQGAGGGQIAITMQVAVQTAVRQADVALSTALELLFAEVGAAMGSALAGLVFSRDLPPALARSLPEMPEAERRRIYGSLSVALSYPLGTHERTGITLAWTSVMRTLCILAAVVLLPAIVFSLSLPNGQLVDANHPEDEAGVVGVARRRSSARSRRALHRQSVNAASLSRSNTDRSGRERPHTIGSSGDLAIGSFDGLGAPHVSSLETRS